jgi:hypothetical protein
MCRLLAVISPTPIDVRYHLDAFASVCRNSPEYQGHGWGYAVLRGEMWDRYRTVTPIWEDGTRPEGSIRVLLAHARSAFRDEGIEVENNMPFVDGDQVFIFNGELHGVRLPVAGRTGAERIFRFLRQPARSGPGDAVGRALAILRSRTAHIRACNVMIADPRKVILHSEFAGASTYFTMHRRLAGAELTICSAPYASGDPAWTPIPQNTVEEYPCSF